MPPRNPVTGSLDLNDNTVYTGYADMPTANIARWKIWYTDHTTYSSAQGGIRTAPVKPIAFGIIKKDNGRYFFVEGHDFYFFDTGVVGYSNDVNECHGTIFPGGMMSDGAYRTKVLEAIGDNFTR